MLYYNYTKELFAMHNKTQIFDFTYSFTYINTIFQENGENIVLCKKIPFLQRKAGSY